MMARKKLTTNAAITKRLVIDGDVFLYRFAFAHQFKVRWDDETISEVVEPFDMAAKEMEKFIIKLLKRVDCDDYIIALSHPRDFRFRVDPNYQAGRANRAAPVHKEPLREYIYEEHPWVQWDWLEADDVLGIMATQDPGRIIIATIDKDLDQIPGVLYNWNRDTFETIPREQADLFFYKQLIMGDSTDGIKGIPGVGPKKAEAYLDGYYGKDEDKIWAHVLDVYHDHGLTPEYALQQARLVRILRHGEYDFDHHKPILWKGPRNANTAKPRNHGGNRKENR